MFFAQLQIFGPVMSLIRFDSMEDLVEIANNTVYGLAAAVVTKDLDKALHVANSIRAGSVWFVSTILFFCNFQHFLSFPIVFSTVLLFSDT